MIYELDENRILKSNFTYPFNLEAECTEIHDVNVSHQCWFASTVEDCVEIIEHLDYNNYIFCVHGLQNVIPAVVVCLLWLLMLFIALGVTSNCFLCPALFAISNNLGLSQNVAGVTLLAFGNGAPDIFSSAAGLHKASPELAISSLLGAGAFVTTIVAGSVFLTQSFSLMVRPFLRDISFYVIAVSWTFALFYCGRTYVYHGIGFISMYVVYIIVVLGSRYVYVKRIRSANNMSEIEKTASLSSIKWNGQKYEYLDDPDAIGVVLTAYYLSKLDILGEVNTNIRKSQIYSLENGGYADSTASIDNLKAKASITNGIASTEKLNPCDSYSTLKSAGEIHHFLHTVCPVNLEKWHQLRWWYKGIAIIKSPAIFILKITVPVIDSTTNDKKWCRLLNVAHCVTGPLFICLVSKYPFYFVGDVVPVTVIVIVSSCIVAGAVLFTSVPDQPPVYYSLFAYLGFAVSVVWIYCLANEIVALLQVFGVVFNLSDSILGLTVLAWGNSLSDFLSNLAVARKKYPRMGISASFGGPLLALLLGLGTPTIIEIVKGRAPAKLPLQFSAQFALLFATVTTSVLMTVIVMSIWKFKTRRWYGCVLISLYVTFVTLAVLEELNIFHIPV